MCSNTSESCIIKIIIINKDFKQTTTKQALHPINPRFVKFKKKIKVLKNHNLHDPSKAAITSPASAATG